MHVFSVENGSTTSFLSRLPTYLVTSVTVSHYNLPLFNSLTIPKQYINWKKNYIATFSNSQCVNYSMTSMGIVRNFCGVQRAW